MTWNYRIIVKHSEHPVNEGERYFEIHECHYEKRKDTLPTSWSKDAVLPMGQDKVKELKADLKMMLKACEKPVLIEKGDKIEEWKP